MCVRLPENCDTAVAGFVLYLTIIEHPDGKLRTSRILWASNELKISEKCFWGALRLGVPDLKIVADDSRDR